MLNDIHMLLNMPTPLLIDNQSTIQVAKNTGPTKRRKFIHLRHHYVTHCTQKGGIAISHVSTSRHAHKAATPPSTHSSHTPAEPHRTENQLRTSRSVVDRGIVMKAIKTNVHVAVTMLNRYEIHARTCSNITYPTWTRE